MTKKTKQILWISGGAVAGLAIWYFMAGPGKGKPMPTTSAGSIPAGASVPASGTSDQVQSGNAVQTATAAALPNIAPAIQAQSSDIVNESVLYHLTYG